MIDLATALWNQRIEIRDAKDRLRQLQRIVNWPGDMPLASGIHLYAFCLEFAPELIVELGRGYGNSTCIFTEAANRLKTTKVVSVGYDGERCWSTRTAPALRNFASTDWFQPLEIIEQDALKTDFAKIFSKFTSILFFWDAHGLQLANYVLAEVLPHLNNKSHVTVVHDISDARYDSIEPRYVRADGYPQFWFGDLVSPFEELAPLYDFLSRNRINYDTPQHSFAGMFENDVAKRTELEQCWGPDCTSPTPLDAGGFVYFDINHRLVDSRSWDLVFPEFKRPDEMNELSVPRIKPTKKNRARNLFKRFGRQWHILTTTQKT